MKFEHFFMDYISNICCISDNLLLDYKEMVPTLGRTLFSLHVSVSDFPFLLATNLGSLG